MVAPNEASILSNPYNTYNLALLHPDGSYDTSFSFVTATEVEVMTTIFINPAGEIIIGGEQIFNKITTTGALDSSFSINFSMALGFIESIDQMATGHYIVGGDFGFSKLVRCFPNGDIDMSWGTGTGFNGLVNKVIVQPDQKIIVAGRFTSYNNMPANKICRLNADGTLDTTFNAGTGPNYTNYSAYIRTMVLQDDGKIVIGGSFNSFNNRNIWSLARLHANGSLDTTFSGRYGPQGNGRPGTIEHLQILDDGKLLATGIFFSYDYPDGSRYNSPGLMRFLLCSDTSLVQTVTACDSFTWIDGNTYTASNDTATFTYTSVGGCDSTITLDLTINPSYNLIDSITAFDSYTWINGITYTASTDTPSMRYTRVNGCDSTISLHLTIDTNTWNGTAWSAGQAPQGTNALIAGNLSNSPAFTANNLTIINGISLSFDADEDLTVNGNLENNGTLDIAANTLTLAGSYSGTGSIRSNGGDLVLNGTGDAGSLRFDQTTDGTTNSVANITLNRTASGEVTIANKVNISQQLVLTNGVINTAGFVHLKSTSATATSTVVGGTNASINGQVTVERFLPWTSAGNNGFRFVSHPLSSNPVINTVSNLPTANNTLVGYNEGSNAYEGINNRTATWPQGIGYGAWTAAVNTLSFTGALQLSDVSPVNMGNAANRWNFAGNPFPSTIDWDALNTTDMQDAVWVWVKDDITEGGGAWASYVEGVSANGGSPYISPMQGFMVRALSGGAPSIAFPASARVSNQTPAFQRNQIIGDVYRIKVTKAANNSALETVIRFRDQATDQHDPAYDAEFMSDFANATPDLYTTDGNGIKYSINALPQIGSSPVLVPLQLETFGAGDFSFTFDASQLVSGVSVQLEDTKQGTFTPLADGQVVNFSAAASDAVNRFRLHFNGLATSVAANKLDLIQLNTYEGALYIRGTERAESLRILDISGRSVYLAQQLELDGNAIRPNLAKGTYLVQLVNELGVKTVKVIF